MTDAEQHDDSGGSRLPQITRAYTLQASGVAAYAPGEAGPYELLYTQARRFFAANLSGRF